MRANPDQYEGDLFRHEAHRLATTDTDVSRSAAAYEDGSGSAVILEMAAAIAELDDDRYAAAMNKLATLIDEGPAGDVAMAPARP